jgi:serine/threonine-protein kinase
MLVQTVAEFLKVLADSQLLSAKSLHQIVEQVRIAPADLSLERVANSLIRTGFLTRFQTQRLLSGRTDGFYLGKYKLFDVLGQGGMGTVYLAEQTTMKRLVAIKIIKNVADCPPETRIRFEREARAAASLSHPNIVQAYDCDEINGVPYIAMEYVEGMDAVEQVERFGRLPWRQAADYMLQAALGLEHARLHCLVHRDIKPANLADRDRRDGQAAGLGPLLIDR